MIKKLKHYQGPLNEEISISGSKSESNRLLILQSHFPNLKLNNLSDSDDTRYLKKALESTEELIDISHAGTAMRFLTSFFAGQEGRTVVLTGSKRMKNRPIGILVEALRSIGAKITYVEKEGYPPLRIEGCELKGVKLKIRGNVSSQYISSLLLLAPALESGLKVELVGEVTSVPYINMTLKLLEEIGVTYAWNGNVISIHPIKKVEPRVITVESDWSSASYYYSLVALSEKGSIKLASYKKDSLQGDSELVNYYKHFGVQTSFLENAILLEKIPAELEPLSLNLVNCPDLAQTIAVTCFGLGVACDLNGLHTLKIKETDRLVALKNELEKLGASIEITENSLHLKPAGKPNANISIKTYDDHRMAMAFAPLALKVPISILDAEVVSKSYTDFWAHFDGIVG